MTSIWGDAALLGRLAGENLPDLDFMVPFDFFSVSLQQVDASGATFQSRMMNALGSNTNRDVMTLMLKDANLIKEKVVGVILYLFRKECNG